MSNTDIQIIETLCEKSIELFNSLMQEQHITFQKKLENLETILINVDELKKGLNYELKSLKTPKEDKRIRRFDKWIIFLIMVSLFSIFIPLYFMGYLSFQPNFMIYYGIIMFSILILTFILVIYSQIIEKKLNRELVNRYNKQNKANK
jgi:hypothetical protein